MGNCGFKTKNTCGDRLYASCTYYEGMLPSFSTLATEDCYTLEEVIADIYILLESINDQIEVDSILGEGCLTYALEGGKITVRQALITMENEICSLKDKFDNIAKYQLCDLPIAGCDLTLQDLADECDGTITTFGELFQALINRTTEILPVSNTVTLDITNTSASIKTVLVYQPSEASQTIVVPSLGTTTVNIDNSKPITIVHSGGTDPQGYFNKITGGSVFSVLDTTVLLPTDLLAKFILGPNGNPEIELTDVS